MSATQVVTVPVTQSTYERLQRRADEQRRSVTDVLDDVVRQIDIADERRRESFRRMGEAMFRMQEESIRNGNSEMTMDEINEEIALARREAAEAEIARQAR